MAAEPSNRPGPPGSRGPPAERGPQEPPFSHIPQRVWDNIPVKDRIQVPRNYSDARTSEMWIQTLVLGEVTERVRGGCPFDGSDLVRRENQPSTFYCEGCGRVVTRSRRNRG